MKVLIVDDHLVVRQGLEQILAEEIRGMDFGAAGTADEAMLQMARRDWDLVMLDIGMPDRDGFQILREMLARRPQTRIVMFSVHSDPQYLAHAQRLGARGYVAKDGSRSELVRIVKHVLAGKSVFPKSDQPAGKPAHKIGHAALSRQEYRVLLALAAGKRIGEIAADLTLNAKTVSTYKRRILHKMQLKSTADLVRYVVDHHLS